MYKQTQTRLHSHDSISLGTWTLHSIDNQEAGLVAFERVNFSPGSIRLVPSFDRVLYEICYFFCYIYIHVIHYLGWWTHWSITWTKQPVTDRVRGRTRPIPARAPSDTCARLPSTYPRVQARLAFIPRVDHCSIPCWLSRAPHFYSACGRAQLTCTSLLSYFTYSAKSFYYSTQSLCNFFSHFVTFVCHS
jgi:hypothetical protein